MAASVIYPQHTSQSVAATTFAAMVPVNTNVTSGLVLHLAADGNDVRRARRTECIFHTLGDAGIVTEQDTGEE